MSARPSYEEISQSLVEAFNEGGIEVPESQKFYDDEYGPTITDVTNYFAENQEARMISFDGECIEDEDAYANLLVDFLQITQGDVEAEIASSRLENGSEVITFSVNGDTYTWDLPREGDWIDNKFLSRVFELVKTNSNGQMIIDRMDDFVTVIYVPQNAAQILLKHYEGAGG